MNAKRVPGQWYTIPSHVDERRRERERERDSVSRPVDHPRLVHIRIVYIPDTIVEVCRDTRGEAIVRFFGPLV